LTSLGFTRSIVSSRHDERHVTAGGALDQLAIELLGPAVAADRAAAGGV
jgi:hypothetical protein